MYTLRANLDEFQCEKAAKGADYIECYRDGEVIARFEGIADFTGYQLIDEGGSEVPFSQSPVEQAQKAEDRLRSLLMGAVIETASPDDVIVMSPLLPEWSQKPYAVGDVVTYADAPYRCVQQHDATEHPDWTPTQYRAGWANYHGATRETALLWIAPTGAHDTYKAGEWMIWTDGAYYECLQNTDHSPEAWPQGWRQG